MTQKSLQSIRIDQKSTKKIKTDKFGKKTKLSPRIVKIEDIFIKICQNVDYLTNLRFFGKIEFFVKICRFW